MLYDLCAEIDEIATKEEIDDYEHGGDNVENGEDKMIMIYDEGSHPGPKRMFLHSSLLLCFTQAHFLAECKKCINVCCHESRKIILYCTFPF